MRSRIAAALGLAGVLVAAAAAAAWVATSPRTISAEVAAAVAEPGDPEAGKNVFYIAGCESCHMSPGQKDPLRLGGGMELKTPFGSFFPPNISPDLRDGIGGWTSADFANALMAGVSPRGRAFVSGFSLSVLSPHVDQGRAGSLRLPAHAAAGLGAGAAERAQVPLLHPPRRRLLEASLPAADRSPDRRRSNRWGGVRPLSRQWARPLRRMPFAARRLRRNHRLPPPDRGPAAGRQGQGAEHNGRRSQGLVRRRCRNRALDRLHPVRRRARQRDDRGRAQPQAGSRAADLAAIARYLKSYRPGGAP